MEWGKVSDIAEIIIGLALIVYLLYLTSEYFD